jgi:cytochrome o ubiquinol oxidase operon protein cyoD
MMHDPVKAQKQYMLGFASSIVLTLAAYLLVTHHVLQRWDLVFAIVLLALVQLTVQLVFFLHLADESRPRLHGMIFGFMVLIVCIIVFGSLWIINSLDYRHSHGHLPTGPEADKAIIKEELIPR